MHLQTDINGADLFQLRRLPKSIDADVFIDNSIKKKNMGRIRTATACATIRVDLENN